MFDTNPTIKPLSPVTIEEIYCTRELGIPMLIHAEVKPGFNDCRHGNVHDIWSCSLSMFLTASYVSTDENLRIPMFDTDSSVRSISVWLVGTLGSKTTGRSGILISLSNGSIRTQASGDPTANSILAEISDLYAPRFASNGDLAKNQAPIWLAALNRMSDQAFRTISNIQALLRTQMLAIQSSSDNYNRI